MCVLRRERERESAYPDGHSGQGSVINLLTSQHNLQKNPPSLYWALRRSESICRAHLIRNESEGKVSGGETVLQHYFV